jgi:thioredoxin-related protein
MKMFRSALCAALLSFPAAAWAETYLLMAEEHGCYWCQKWDKEIAHIYPKTDEGRAAPLQRYDLRAVTPEVEFKKRVSFTPTFILVKDGKEVGRIEGHPGQDFFWPMLQILFKEANIPFGNTG